MNVILQKLDWHYHDYDELLLNTNNKHNKHQQLAFFYKKLLLHKLKYKHNKHQQLAFYKKLLLHKLKYYEAGYNLQLIITKSDKNDY